MATEPRLRLVTEDPDRDLGFGSVVARSRQRLLNRDGSFNVVRDGMRPFASLSLYHRLLTTTWPRFLGLVTAYYVVSNALFATLFTALGPDALVMSEPAETLGERWLMSFFFSVDTFATIGYGNISPQGTAANMLVVIEALLGLLGFALVTGLLFARFSRPTAKILFSENALIAPYHGITAFQFRIVNARSNQLIQMRAKVMLSRFTPGQKNREFVTLKLERDDVVFFPLAWTIVHPIDEESPLYGLTYQDFLDSDVELVILLTAIDETFAQTVHARSSYKAEEIVWGAKFANLFNPPRPDGVLSIDVGRLHEFERIELR